MEAQKKRPITIELTAEQRLQLRVLLTSPAMGGSPTGDPRAPAAPADGSLQDVLQYIVASVCDGIRRPGSWERGCVAQMFGEWDCPLPPLCVICDFDVIDPDEPLEVESQHCERCFAEAMDQWVESATGLHFRGLRPEEPDSCWLEGGDDAIEELIALALGEGEPREEDARAARELIWEALGRKSPLQPHENWREVSVSCDDDGGLSVDVH